MPILVPRIPFIRRRRRPAFAAPPVPPPVAVHLVAVHTQPAPPGGSELMFIFDDDVISIDGVAAEQFQCEVDGNPPLLGDSVIEFDGAHILVAFAQDVSSATLATLLSGENIVFDGGGTAAGGQSAAVTPGGA